MKPLYPVATLRQIEHQAGDLDLISRAGAASAGHLLSCLPDAHHFSIMMGPGNNGQDALACARLLQQAGKHVTLQLLPGKPVSAELANEFADISSTMPQRWGDVIVDGLFGIGFNRALDTDTLHLLASANQASAIRIALDIPSGLDADLGSASQDSFVAHQTLSFIADKPGFYTAQGRDYCGTVHTFDLGIAQLLPSADLQLINRRSDLRMLLRPHESHKGSYGTVAVIGGQRGMIGAALLAARAALHAGAGKVHVGLIDAALQVDPAQPELMLDDAASVLGLPGVDAYVIGPGLGRGEAAKSCLFTALQKGQPLLIDADGLNLISQDSTLAEALVARKAPTALTPHPAEAARLLARSTQDIQARRIDAARQLATQSGAAVALKGSGTVCSDGTSTSINGSGNALLANAGQGDVLGGIAGALLAQG
ncbi:NAD(P)H-hydrate dehydratase, partial [Andreprevotia sp. IGB-42]|uniref:NAD(P)H-hydrate dehydratase n=1 Tax=Andreprevotia sp. IGB-42 TaxID=2497473 RepID=UPI001356E11E